MHVQELNNAFLEVEKVEQTNNNNYQKILREIKGTCFIPLHQLAMSDAGHPISLVLVHASLDKQGSLYCHQEKKNQTSLRTNVGKEKLCLRVPERLVFRKGF